MNQSPEPVLHEFVYFTRDQFPNATGRTIWTCGESYFLVSSIVNEDMSIDETMVFLCNSLGEKINGSEDLAYLPDAYPSAEEVKEAIQRAYANRMETLNRDKVENFVRYEATAKQLSEIKSMFMDPKVSD